MLETVSITPRRSADFSGDPGPQAVQDVEAIRAHVARDSVHYADLVVERLVAAVERLQDHPRSGALSQSLATSRSARSSTATIESSIAYATTLSRLRRCFTGLVPFGLTDQRGARASNFRLQPIAARYARCGG